MAKKNFFTVWKGRQNGVFDNWEKCNASVFRFSYALYEGFSTYEEALNAYEMGYEGYRKWINDHNDFVTQALF